MDTKRKINIAFSLLLWLFFTTFSIHSKAQNKKGVETNNIPTAFQSEYNSVRHFDSSYKYAEMKFRFNGTGRNAVIKWQQAFLPHLKQAIGLDKMEGQLAGYIPRAEKKETEERNGFVLEKWIIWTEPDIPLPIVVLIPKNKTGKIPLVITTHGHGKNAEQYDGIYPRVVDTISSAQPELSICVQAVNEGYIAIAPTMRAFGSTRTEYDKNNGNSFSCHDQLMHDLLVGRTPIGDRVWDMSKILDWAIRYLPVDTKRIAITGNSGGGTASLFAAACDPRITVAVPSSSFCTFAGSIGVIAHCDCNYIPGILGLGEMSDIAGLITPRPLCLINGKEDPIFPIGETRKAFAHLKSIYSAAAAADDVELYEGSGGHKFYKEGAWPFIKKHFEK